jgi:hypothetical protein
MRVKLLRRLRKQFDWKFRYLRSEQMAIILYDKKYNIISKNYYNPQYELNISDFEFVLRSYGDDKLLERYMNKKIKSNYEKI